MQNHEKKIPKKKRKTYETTFNKISNLFSWGLCMFYVMYDFSIHTVHRTSIHSYLRSNIFYIYAECHFTFYLCRCLSCHNGKNEINWMEIPDKTSLLGVFVELQICIPLFLYFRQFFVLIISSYKDTYWLMCLQFLYNTILILILFSSILNGVVQ